MSNLSTKDNGVVCWFYVYKENDDKTTSICGIVIIKKLTDVNTKLFFYTETKIETVNGSQTFKNDSLIKEFINTQPNKTSIINFLKKNNNTKYDRSNKSNKDKLFEINDYNYLRNFLRILKDNKFNIFINN
jgi:hypothetical protein